MKHFLFFIPRLTNSAGMERMSTSLANELVAAGARCSFVVLGDDLHSFFPLAEGVNVYGLKGIASVRSHRLKAARMLHNILRRVRPDVLVNVDVSMIQIAALAMPATLGVKMVSWEQFSMAGNPGLLPTLKRWFAALVSTRLVVLTEADRLVYPSRLLSNIKVIKNFTHINPDGRRSTLTECVVVAVGRLCATKGFDLLIEAWGEVHRQCPEWRLRIVGNGSDHGLLQRQIDMAGLQDTVTLMPATPRIAEEYLGASLFVMSSRNEPFGLVLIEAQAFGLPVVSFDCPYGPGEILHHDRDGMLVANGDVAAMARALVSLMKNHAKLATMADAAYENYQNNYRPEHIVEKWLKMA